MKIRVKKKQIINEAAMGPADLPKNYCIEIFDGRSFVEVNYKLIEYDGDHRIIENVLIEYVKTI